jgi:type IX secretion system PorP/SprF family membrane protein
MHVFYNHDMIRTTKKICISGIFGCKKWIYIVLSFMLIIPLRAQEVSFTMFKSNPLYLNPALTGDFSGDWRLAGNFRNQWSAASDPFRTATISFDKKVYILDQKFGVGIFMLNDESGTGGLVYNKVYASLSYERAINNNYVKAGLQVGMVFGSFNDWMVWDNSSGSFISPSGEEGLGESTSFPDVNFGLAWKRNINIFEPEAGISLSHLNSPNKSFLGGDYKEGMKITFHSNIKIKLNDKIYLEPAILYITKDKSGNTILGTNIGYKIRNKRIPLRQVYGGAYLRNGLLDDTDAFAVHAGTTIRRIDLGFSYDFNMSDLGGTGGSLGTFELSFIYRSISTVLNSYSIPCERL